MPRKTHNRLLLPTWIVLVTVVVPWLCPPVVGAQPVDLEERQVSRRTPILSDVQAKRYLDYVEYLWSNDMPEQALPVLKLLISAGGVPDSVRLRAEQLFEGQEDDEYPYLEWYRNLSLLGSAMSDDDVGGDYDGRLDTFDADASVSLGYTLNESLSAYIEVGVASGTYLNDDDELAADPEFYRDETWIDVDFSTERLYRSLTIGSQSVYENRGWWWDDTLDLVLLTMNDQQWFLQSGIGVQATHRLFGERFYDNDEVIRGLVELSYEWRDQQSVSAFAFGEFDQSERPQPGMPADEWLLDDSGKELFWLGVRGQGVIEQEAWPSFEYWIDLAHVGGRETRYDLDFSESDEDVSLVTDSNRIDVAGWGMDLGVSMPTSLPADPRLSVGFATTFSGVSATGTTDRSFQQTGLQSNVMQLGSSYDVNSYGLVLNPELSNLQILTLGIGFDVLSNSTFSLMGHDYRLLSATENLRSADIDLTFNGNDKHIGRAIDLVLLVDEWDTWNVEMQFGMFQAGRAVAADADATAYNGSVELSVDF